nr:hypothetical protein [Tanacetum cinerariifolium]
MNCSSVGVSVLVVQSVCSLVTSGGATSSVCGLFTDFQSERSDGDGCRWQSARERENRWMYVRQKHKDDIFVGNLWVFTHVGNQLGGKSVGNLPHNCNGGKYNFPTDVESTRIVENLWEICHEFTQKICGKSVGNQLGGKSVGNLPHNCSGGKYGIDCLTGSHEDETIHILAGRPIIWSHPWWMVFVSYNGKWEYDGKELFFKNSKSEYELINDYPSMATQTWRTQRHPGRISLLYEEVPPRRYLDDLGQIMGDNTPARTRELVGFAVVPIPTSACCEEDGPTDIHPRMSDIVANGLRQQYAAEERPKTEQLLVPLLRPHRTSCEEEISLATVSSSWPKSPPWISHPSRADFSHDPTTAMLIYAI